MAKKTFRIMQSGDWHIGKGRASWTSQVSLERGAAMIDAIYEKAHAGEVDALIVAGDVFDNKHVTNKERVLLAKKMAQHASENGGIPTYMIPGNHDMTSEDNTNLDWIAIIAQEEMPNLHIALEPTMVRVAKGLYFDLVPARWSEDQEWMDGSRAWLKANAKGKVVFVGHAALNGCVFDNSYTPDAEYLSLKKASKSKKVIWWAYGDIHKRQELPTLSKGAAGMYAGTPIQMNFAEKPGRGVEIVDLVKRGKSWEVAQNMFVRIDDDKRIRPLHTVLDADEDIPMNALIKISKDVVLDDARRASIVGTIVDDQSHGVGHVEMSKQVAKAVPFDPLLGDPSVIAASIKKLMKSAHTKEQRTSKSYKAARKKLPSIVAEAISRHRDRNQL